MADPRDTPDLFGAASPAQAETAGSGSSAASSAPSPGDPLAVRMRPSTLDEVVGQSHLLGPGTPLRRLVESDAALSVVLWGPPGTGKTTIAHVVSRATARRYVELSALTAGVKEVRAVIAEARERLSLTGTRTVAFIDEVHRFSRTQQDSLLAAVENRWVSLIAATTENPSFSMVAPLLSRSLLLTLQPLGEAEIATVLGRALADERGYGGRVTLEPDAAEHLVRMAGGDARRALTYLEAAADAAPGGLVDLATIERAVDTAAVRYDRAGDQHYDVVSAWIKSMRGSDPDAAVHYLARMIEAGEDPRFLARRLMVHASEDVGLADPTALQAAVAASHVVATVGLPEARLALTQATLHIALAPKSNAVITAYGEAAADVRAGLGGAVPAHLRDAHYAGANRLGHGQGYRYPHDEPDGVVRQQYAPQTLTGRRYYRPTARGAERLLGERLQLLRERVVPGQAQPDEDPAGHGPQGHDRPGQD